MHVFVHVHACVCVELVCIVDVCMFQYFTMLSVISTTDYVCLHKKASIKTLKKSQIRKSLALQTRMKIALGIQYRGRGHEIITKTDINVTFTVVQ